MAVCNLIENWLATSPVNAGHLNAPHTHKAAVGGRQERKIIIVIIIRVRATIISTPPAGESIVIQGGLSAGWTARREAIRSYRDMRQTRAPLGGSRPPSEAIVCTCSLVHFIGKGRSKQRLHSAASLSVSDLVKKASQATDEKEGQFFALSSLCGQLPAPVSTVPRSCEILPLNSHANQREVAIEAARDKGVSFSVIVCGQGG